MNKRLTVRSLAVLLLLVLVVARDRRPGKARPADGRPHPQGRAREFEDHGPPRSTSATSTPRGCRPPRSTSRRANGSSAKAKELGLANAAMEPYGTFGRSWELQKFYAAMTAPQYMPLIGYPKAWTPGTNGVLKGTGRPDQRPDGRRPGQVQGQAQGRHRPHPGRTGPPDLLRPDGFAAPRDRPAEAHAGARARRPPAGEPADAGRGGPPAAPAGDDEVAQGRGRRRRPRAQPGEVRDGLRRRAAGRA